MSASATAVPDSTQSAGAIKNKANFIAAQSKGLEDAQIHQASAAALSNLQDQINSQGKTIRALSGVSTTITVDNSYQLEFLA